MTDDDPSADNAADSPEDPVESDERRYPSTIGGAFYIVVLILTAVGIWIVSSGDWRVGIRWVGGALIGAAVVRLILPHRDAGMLAVRHRIVDVILLGGVGGTLIFLANTIPNQPG